MAAPATTGGRGASPGSYVPPRITKTHGSEDTKEEATAAFSKALCAWLTHTGEKDLTAKVLAEHQIGSRPLSG
jgi:hypothetical protein